jgi:hypothetical protein
VGARTGRVKLLRRGGGGKDNKWSCSVADHKNVIMYPNRCEGRCERQPGAPSASDLPPTHDPQKRQQDPLGHLGAPEPQPGREEQQPVLQAASQQQQRQQGVQLQPQQPLPAEGPGGGAHLHGQQHPAGLPGGLHPAVWDVVALAAVAVMERGRQCMYNVWDTRTALPRAHLVSIAAEVMADFWARLASFGSLGIAPRDWHFVPPGHPFLSCVSDRVVMNRSPDVASAPGSPVL